MLVINFIIHTKIDQVKIAIDQSRINEAKCRERDVALVVVTVNMFQASIDLYGDVTRKSISTTERL